MRVGFVGPFGDSNLGDYGMLINNIYDINVKDVSIFTYNVPLISRLAQRYLKNYRLDLCEVNLISERNPSGAQQCKERVIEYNLYPDTPFEILKKVQNYPNLLEKLKKNRYFSSKWRWVF